jgi:regulatory protein
MRRGPRTSRPPLDEERLNERMLAYVARFATSRAKLAAFLSRKVKERGWAGDGEPPIDALVDKAARAGYIDDAAYALSKARSLTIRGYGARRVGEALHAAGIAADDGKAARDLSREQAVDSALHFARKRRIGPFAAERLAPEALQKALAAMIRAGHGFRLAKAILDLGPGAQFDPQALEEER